MTIKAPEELGITCIWCPDNSSNHQRAKCGAHLVVPAQMNSMDPTPQAQGKVHV